MDNKDSAGLRLKIKSGAAANKKASVKWIVSIFIWTFVLSVAMGVGSSTVLEELNIVFAFLILIIIVSIGIVFDMIGIAVTTADETPFHALAAKKYKSAACSIKLIRNAEKVSSFCNDVIGDIAGIVSGSTLAVIVAHIFSEGNSAVSVIMTGVLSAVTVGGKAIGKTTAMKNANKIVHIASVIIYSFSRKKK